MKPTNIWNNELHRGNSKFKIDRRGHYMHDTAQKIREDFPEKFKNYRKFSVVRNPWDQMVSLYFRLNGPSKVDTRFAMWLKSFELIDGTVPRYSLFDEDGTILVDKVCRFEDLSSDYSRMLADFEIDAPELHKLNPSSKQGYKKYYDDESYETVRQLYAKDIEYFEYKF